MPATLPRVRGWFAGGTTPAGVRSWAVTPALREWYADGDAEELEYAATVLAGRDSLRLLAEDPSPVPRRVVLAVDVPDAHVRLPADADRGEVLLTSAVPVGAWAAVLVDEPAAERLVIDGVTAIGAADEGDEDAGLRVGDVEDADLLWWAVQELHELT